MEILFVIIFVSIVVFISYLSYLAKKSEKKDRDAEDEVLDKLDEISAGFETEIITLDKMPEKVDDSEVLSDVPAEKFKARRNKEERASIDEEII